MLDKDWLLTCAPLGIFDSSRQTWKPLGAGVFIYDQPFIWYVTAKHSITQDTKQGVSLLINHATLNKYLVSVELLHKEHKIGWVMDKNHDLAATLFPADPNFKIKAIEISSLLETKEMVPSMRCYSIGCPYGWEVLQNWPVWVLDGIISGVDTERSHIYVTTPTFPGNSGGPLFVWVEPNKADGSVHLGGSPIRLGGIVSEYVLVNGVEQKHANSLPPLHLGKVIASEAVLKLLQSEPATKMKQLAESKK